MIYNSKGLRPKNVRFVEIKWLNQKLRIFKYDFLFFDDPLPNMVMSRDTDSLFIKFVTTTKFPIKFQESLPNLVLLLLSEQKLWRPKNLVGRIPYLE